MTARLNPYVNFKANARAAMEFYKSVLGGTLTVTTFGEGGGAPSPDEADLVMHAQLETPSGFTLMGSDTPSRMPFQPGTTMSISLSGTSADELTGYWNGLSQGATITMPLAKAPWGDSFGMLVDKFGVAWLVNISASQG